MATLSDVMDKLVYFIPNGQYIIPIHPIKVSNTRSKKLSKRTPSQSTQNRANGPKDTKIKDKLRIENVYEVDGLIEPIETGDTDPSYFPNVTTAAQLRNQFLKYIFNNEVDFFMYYEGEAIQGSVEKVDITEECMDKTTTTAPKFSIKFIFVAVDNTITI